MLAPFRGIRYARDRVSGIANVTSPPYDVINGDILDHLRAADPHNVVRLILPGEDADASKAAASLLREWLSAGVLIRDRMASLYIYEQSDDADPACLQRGIIGLVRLGPPDSAGILPHEGVMPGLVAGRRELMAATQANLEPIFLIYDGEQPGAAVHSATGHPPGGHRGGGHQGRGPGHGRARAAGVDHDGGRRDPPAVADRRFRRAGRDLRRPGRAPGSDRRRPSPVCRLPGPAGRDARGRPGRRAVGLRAGVPGRLGGLPAPAGRHPPGAARPAAGPRGRTGQGRVYRAGPAAPGSAWTTRCSAWPRPGRRVPPSCWPAVRCSAC